MVKTKLEMEHVIAIALLLGFERIYKDDITLLAEDFEKNPNYDLNVENSKHTDKYIKSKNEEITLKDGLNMKSYIPENESNLRNRLEQIEE